MRSLCASTTGLGYRLTVSLRVYAAPNPPRAPRGYTSRLAVASAPLRPFVLRVAPAPLCVSSRPSHRSVPEMPSPLRASATAPGGEESPAATRGAFIVFEGVDRCGKSSQTKMLVEHLNSSGVKAELWCYPDRTTEIGQMINAYLGNQKELSDQAVHLLFAANRWEKSALMESKLKEGVTLVCDRYSYSGVAFTSAKEKPGLDLDWCTAPERGLIAPDAVVYLQIDVEEAAKRGGFGEERYEKLEMQKRVKENFEAMKDDNWHVINALQTPEEVKAEVESTVKPVIEKCSAGSPLTYF